MTMITGGNVRRGGRSGGLGQLRGADGVLTLEAPRHDLGDSVAAHADAVEDVGRLHRAALVRDDDELRAVGVSLDETQEAVDVPVVERGLDLVHDVERAWAREEDRE